jgi:hypothetical protein
VLLLLLLLLRCDGNSTAHKQKGNNREIYKGLPTDRPTVQAPVTVSKGALQQEQQNKTKQSKKK